MFSQYNYSLNFDGEDDYVDLPTIISDGNSSFTISFWIKLNNLSINNALISRTEDNGNIWELSWNPNSNTLHFMSRDDDWSNYHNYSESSLNQDEWYYITTQREVGVAKRLYINGELEIEIDDPNVYLTLPELRIGAAAENQNYADMLFDELQIWNTALMQSEVQLYMNTQLTGEEEDLVGYWNFNSGSGNILYDHSANHNHGTIFGNAEWIINEVLGCTDTYASNYNEEANIDDGSCTYPDNGDYSLSFDGVDDYVEFNTISPFDASESISLEATFKWNGPNQTSDGQFLMIFAQDGPGNAKIAMDNNGLLNAGILQCNCEEDDDSYLYYTIQQGQWYNLVYSYDTLTGDVNLFVNGELVESSNYPFSSYYNVNNSKTRLGNYHFNEYHFNGQISFAQIVNDVIFPNQNSIHENAIGYWNLDEGSEDILNDLSGNGNNGFIHGATWVENIYGCTDELACNYDVEANVDDDSCDYSCHDNGDYSLEFDGDDYVDFNYTNLYDISEDFTWEGNFKIDDINSNYIIVEQNSYYNLDGYFINYWGSGNFEKTIWFSICSDSTCYQYYGFPYPVQNNTWFNLAIVKKSNDINIYIDGIDITYGTVNLNDSNIMDYYIPSTENLRLGADISSPWPAYYSGQIERISLWNSALIQSEVQLYMNTQFTGEEEDLVGYWNFNSGEGNILYDQSGNQNHGTIYGAEWVSTTSMGDVNVDGNLDIIDIVLIVNHILGQENLDGNQIDLADISGDGIINIVDIVMIIEIIFDI